MATSAADPERLIDQLDAATTLPACTVLSGDETLLVNEVADAVRRAGKRLGCTEFNHLVLDARGDWSGLLGTCQNSSLFGDLRFVDLSLPTGKPGKTGADTLQKLLALASGGHLPDVRVLIRLPQLDRATRQSKWGQALKKGSHWIDLPSIQRPQLPAWIQRRLARQHQHADSDTLAWLTDKVEGNLLAAHQEIQKLALLYPEGALSLDQVQAAVLNVARYNPYDLRDAMMAGQAARALTILQGLRAEGEAQLLVLWAIGEEIRTLARLADTPPPDRGAALRAMRIFGAREQRAHQALQRVPAHHWSLALRHAHDIDCLIKGIPVDGRLTDPWAELARLIMRVACAGTRPS